MSDTIIKPEEFMDLSINQYVLKLDKDLKILGKNKSKEYPYLFIEEYKFSGKRMDLLLFIDVEDKTWQANLPFLKAIATGKKVIDGESIEREYVKYINNSVFGKCKISEVADFDGDGDPDYAFAVVTAYGRGASKQKAVKSIGQSELLEGQDMHVQLPKGYKETLQKSRMLKEIEKEDREKDRKKKKHTGEESVDTSGEMSEVSDEV